MYMDNCPLSYCGEYTLDGFSLKKFARSVKKTIKKPQRLIRVVLPGVPTKYLVKIEKEIKRGAEYTGGFVAGGLGVKAKWVGIKSARGVARFKKARKIGRIVMPIVAVAGVAFFYGPTMLASAKTMGSSIASKGAGVFGKATWFKGALTKIGPKAAGYLIKQGVSSLTATPEEVIGATLAVGEASDADILLLKSMQKKKVNKGVLIGGGVLAVVVMAKGV